MNLVAFAKTPAGLVRIYDHGNDWQIIGHGFERWFSVWGNDREGSLQRAIDNIPEVFEIIYT